MKRSQSINLASMRKHAALSVPVKPLALAISATTFVACSSNETAQVFRTVDECVEAGIASQDACQLAYDNALKEAQKSGPKYNSKADCQVDFGTGQCVEYRGSGGQNWFIPLMAGFILGDIIGNRDDRYHYYHSAPMYTSYSHRSPYFGRWSTVDGYSYGSVYDRKVKVPKKTFEPKPAVKKTISRGGFGSKVAAKSNWGGGKRSGFGGGWGG